MKKISTIIMVVLCVMSVNAQNSKLSPYVRQAMMTQKAESNSAKAKAIVGSAKMSVPHITAFVRTTDIDLLRREGCSIYAQWDSFDGPTTSYLVIASIPLDKLSTLASMTQIKRIEAGQSCSVTNDTTATITKTREVWQQTINSSTTSEASSLTGNGVVVGVMDIGFDLTHPTFYSPDGQTYRVKQMWDQLDQTQGGEPVIGETTDGRDTIYVGRQYIGQEALLALQHTYDGLTQTHGTHTTGTAAGSGWHGDLTTSGSQNLKTYSGMASDADICLVCNMAGDNADLVPDSLQYLYTTATDMLGFKYIFDYADKVGKPCVISFSEGGHDDLWESGIYSEVLSKMLGPGHILCASAGNEGSSDGTYVHKAVGETSKGAFLAKWASNTAIYVLRSKKPVQMLLSFYDDSKKILDKNYDLTELAQYPDSMMIDSLDINGDTVVVYLQTYPSCFDENLYATDFFLKDFSDIRYGYNIPTSMALLGEDNDIEAFCGGGYFVKNDMDPSLADFDVTHNILFPGSSKDVICVGATSYATSWRNVQGNYVGTNFGTDGVRARYSSVGPALNGLTKPDVMAPGSNVISSRSSFYRDYGSEILLTEYNGRTYPWGIMSGTSMATPVTAGVVALWLQACPTLTPDQVKDVIAHTASHYDETLLYPNNYYGWGQIDALAGVEYIQKTYTGIEEMENGKMEMKNSDAIYTLDGSRVMSLDGLHGVFVVGGKKIVR